MIVGECTYLSLSSSLMSRYIARSHGTQPLGRFLWTNKNHFSSTISLIISDTTPRTAEQPLLCLTPEIRLRMTTSLCLVTATTRLVQLLGLLSLGVYDFVNPNQYPDLLSFPVSDVDEQPVNSGSRGIRRYNDPYRPLSGSCQKDPQELPLRKLTTLCLYRNPVHQASSTASSKFPTVGGKVSDRRCDIWKLTVYRLLRCSSSS